MKGLIKTSIFVLLIALFLTGCGFKKANLPALDQQIDLTSDGRLDTASEIVPAIDESPRTGSGVELPPTWTPGAPEVEPEPPQLESTVEPVSVPVVDEAKTYVVQPGDTLAEIAERFSVTLEQIASANNIVDIDHIETGQELLIPSP